MLHMLLQHVVLVAMLWKCGSWWLVTGVRRRRGKGEAGCMLPCCPLPQRLPASLPSGPAGQEFSPPQPYTSKTLASPRARMSMHE